VTCAHRNGNDPGGTAAWKTSSRRQMVVRFLEGCSAVGVAVLLLTTPLSAHAQQPAADVPRVGVLMFMPMTKAAQEDFREGLRDHGYVEGKNIVVEWRSAEGSTDRASALAADLVRLKVSVIVAEFTPAVRAAKNATQTIPIVMASAGDPVATGLVASLARPGGNITGFTNLAAELSGKRLELLREIIPGTTHVGLLIHGADPLDKAFVEETRKAAVKAGIRLQEPGVSTSRSDKTRIDRRCHKLSVRTERVSGAVPG